MDPSWTHHGFVDCPWNYHGPPRTTMGCSWTATKDFSFATMHHHGLSMKSPCTAIDYPRNHQGLFMDHHGLPLDDHGLFMDCPQTHCEPRWTVHGTTVDFSWTQPTMNYHGLSMEPQRTVHGGSMDCFMGILWTIRGGSMNSPWWSMDSPWRVDAKSMVVPWAVHRGPR